MKIAPLIHSRTLYRDFNPNFAVRPADLNVDWAMNKILPSTRDIDILDGMRRVVANDGKICIAGIACNFKMFAEKFLSAEECAAAEKYFCDERGREIKVFLGYAFKDGGVPDVSDSKLWQMFEKYFAPQWELQTPETVIAPYESCGVKSVTKRPFDKKFYPTNERDDIALFEQCLAERKNFCSNVDAVKIAQDGQYEIITASQSVINRLQAEAQKKTPPPPSSNRAQTAERSFQTQHTPNHKPPSTSGGKGAFPLICAAVVIVLAIIFFVMSPKPEERDSRTSMNYAPTLTTITKVQKSATVMTANIAWYQSAKERRNHLLNV